MHNRCEVFAEVLAEHVNSAGPQSEKSSCIFRASPAQAPRKQKDASSWKWGTGPHVPPAYYSHQNSRQRRLAKYCQRDLSTQRRRKGRQRTAVNERQRKARSDVMSCSSSATSSSDSSDWKKSAQVHCCREIEALVFLLAGLMIVRQGIFFNWEKRRHASKCVIRPILGTNFSNMCIPFFPSSWERLLIDTKVHSK